MEREPPGHADQRMGLQRGSHALTSWSDAVAAADATVRLRKGGQLAEIDIVTIGHG